MLVALLLRCFGLGSQSFWIDEINVTSFVKSGHLFSDLRDRGGPYEPPLHYLTVLAALQLPFGFETAARIPSAVFGALEVLALVLLTLEATRRRATALIAGSLLTVAPFVVRYSQENRYYVMFSTLVLVSWWLLLRALRLRTTWSWVWYGVTAAAMQLTHPFAPLVLGIEAGVVAVVAWRERKQETLRPLLRGYVVAVLIGIILILPWYAYGALDWVEGIRSGKRYGFNAKGSGYTVPIDRELFTRMAEWLLGNSRELTVLVATLVAAIVAAPFLARGRDRKVSLFALAYTLGFMLVLVPLARTIGTYFAYRRVESLVPPLLLVAAIGIVALVDRLVCLRVDRKVALAAGAAVLVVILGLSLAATIEYFGTEKSNYREMARIIRSTPDDEDVLITANADPARILQYLSWQDVERPVTFIIKNDPPDLPAMDEVVWLTGSSPERDDMRTRALNDLDEMQIVAGDSSGPLAILPWFVSRSEPDSRAQLNEQAEVVSRLPHLLPPPRASGQ